VIHSLFLQFVYAYCLELKTQKFFVELQQVFSLENSQNQINRLREKEQAFCFIDFQKVIQQNARCVDSQKTPFNGSCYSMGH